MNIQAMMKQAQALQKDMLKIKDEIDNSDFVGENAMIKITIKGSKQISNVELKVTDSLDSDDIDMLQDMIKSAYNEAAKKVDDTTEKKMGKFGNIPGLF